MRVLFDQGTPLPLRRHLSAHQVQTTFDLQWGTLQNGVLLEKAEAAGFEVFVTTDQNLKYQQNFAARRIAIIVISTTSWPRIERLVASVVRAIAGAVSGAYAEVPIP